MSIELLLLAILGGITLLAYMVAINAHGPTRLSISYLLATVLLAATVWAVVEQYNSSQNAVKKQELLRLEAEKQQAVDLVKSQEQTLLMSQGRTVVAGRLSAVISQGTALATTLMNVDLKDLSLELSVLIAKANAAKTSVSRFKESIDKLPIDDTFFAPSIAHLKEAAEALNEAAQYYVLYYRSEDSAQEDLRERLMRQKAREANEKCMKASALLARSN